MGPHGQPYEVLIAHGGKAPWPLVVPPVEGIGQSADLDTGHYEVIQGHLDGSFAVVGQ